ncbi:MAG: DUF1501 domain-containing protein [Pseudohongiellaceae bacterium]
MDRRAFTKLLGMAGLTATAPLSLTPAKAAEPYTGKFYISLAALGGWDVTSFCDPKTNVAGERTINSWALTDDIQQAGNISFAPVASNTEFFNRFYKDMLVVNGIDTQTNSHDDGQRHTWSGRIGFGYPTFGAIAASSIAPSLPLALVHDAGHSETAGLTRFSRLQNPEILRNLVNDNAVIAGNNTFGLYDQTELDLITQYQSARLSRMQSASDLLPRHLKNVNNLILANSSREDLAAFSNLLPENFEQDNDFRAAQLALTAYQSGLCVSAQLGFSGFDTHQNHDETHFVSLAKLTDLISFIFDTAEQKGFADKIVLTVGSDFGRTPYYNAGAGKDHWPIGSALFISQGAAWGNQVVGATDEGHNALNINPSTLQVDDSSAGVRLEPKHLQQTMREVAGLHDSTIANSFPLEVDGLSLLANSA